MAETTEKKTKKVYVEPTITSCEVEPSAYAVGSVPQQGKWLEYCVFFACCDHNILPWSFCK